MTDGQNKPLKPSKKNSTELNAMINYDQDFYGWTQEQAALLKAGRLNELDITHLIEEVETMGRSEKRALESRLTVLLVHLLKWQHQPNRRGRSWTLTIEGQRIKLLSVIKDNPGLKPQLPDLLADAYRLAKVNASKETGLDKRVFEPNCPWTWAQIMDDAFLPDEPVLKGGVKYPSEH